jgi:hypothetical protein
VPGFYQQKRGLLVGHFLDPALTYRSVAIFGSLAQLLALLLALGS